MWAHYGDQHRGLCIGYDSALLEGRELKKYKKLPIISFPRKIDYDTNKNDFQNYEFNKENSDEMLKSILEKQLTTKGNDWIYEKEHRLIVPIGRADKFRYKRSLRAANRTSYTPDDFYKYVEENSDFDYEIKERGDLIAKKIAHDAQYTFLLNIDKKYIKSVYIGCRMKRRIANKIKDQILSDPELSHVKISKFKVSLDRFELEVDPDFLNP
nr:DUF2971 domain-containing protein [Aeromonas sp. MR19]